MMLSCCRRTHRVRHNSVETVTMGRRVRRKVQNVR
jgi:hypothetical protein